uniref:BTB domain-containing protein n=1 Tax=Stomoxys calcitrans TaxID=35570 RepID=A0A1I8P261_STOCA
MTAENYHLKWDSHSTYLNSSVATLYKNEKYADVVLYSSNSTLSANSSMPTVGISAHKFILSSCSQFFSSIFETSPIANGSNGQFHIVLPPDLSHRAIQILVQYMYVGEATVSNDILSEVLKGGELLKIRGLCRTPSPLASSMQHQNRTSDVQQTVSTSNAATYNLIRMPLNTGPTSVRYLVEQQQAVSRGLSASGLPKTSPVIMKSTKPIGTLAVPAAAVNIGNMASSSNAISINKHVAIDPGEKCCYPTQESAAPLRDESTTSMCNELGCNGCSRMTENPPHPPSQIILQRESSHPHTDTSSNPMCTKNCSDYLPPTTGGVECPEENTSNLYEQDIHLSNAEHDHSDGGGSMLDAYGGGDGFVYSKHLTHPKQTTVIRGEGDRQHLVAASPPAHTQQVVATTTSANTTSYVSIKEEPADWIAPSSTMHSLKKNIVSNADYKMQKIKTEPPPATNSSLSMDTAEPNHLLSSNHAATGNDFDTYFACDICKKVCEDKSSLLRHLETHAVANAACSSVYSSSTSVGGSEATGVQKSSYVPKKRRRISQQENTSDHVCLQCDICSTRFETPQEWVRHMSTQHTEVELAIYNNKKDAEKNQPQSSSNHKKMGCNIQQHHSQRVQALSSGSTNSNLSNNSSVLCTSSPNGSGINDANATGYLRTTLSPA